MLSGIETVWRVCQPLKVSFSIHVTDGGIIRCRIPVSLNASGPIYSTPFAIVNVLRYPHPLKAPASIHLTACGILRIPIDVPLNASAPIYSRVSGSVSSVSC